MGQGCRGRQPVLFTAVGAARGLVPCHLVTDSLTRAGNVLAGPGCRGLGCYQVELVAFGVGEGGPAAAGFSMSRMGVGTLDLDPFYSSGNGSHIPDYTNIVVDGAKAVSSASGATSVLEGYSSSDPLGLTLENVLPSTPPPRTCAASGSPEAHPRECG